MQIFVVRVGYCLKGTVPFLTSRVSGFFLNQQSNCFLYLSAVKINEAKLLVKSIFFLS